MPSVPSLAPGSRLRNCLSIRPRSDCKTRFSVFRGTFASAPDCTCEFAPALRAVVLRFVSSCLLRTDYQFSQLLKCSGRTFALRKNPLGNLPLRQTYPGRKGTLNWRRKTSSTKTKPDESYVSSSANWIRLRYGSGCLQIFADYD